MLYLLLNVFGLPGGKHLGTDSFAIGKFLHRSTAEWLFDCERPRILQTPEPPPNKNKVAKSCPKLTLGVDPEVAQKSQESTLHFSGFHVLQDLLFKALNAVPKFVT